MDFTLIIPRSQVDLTPENFALHCFDAHPTTIDKTVVDFAVLESAREAAARGLVGRRLPDAQSQGAPVPPTNNMGALNTTHADVLVNQSTGEVSGSAKIDWGSFTMPVVDGQTMSLVEKWSTLFGGGVPLDYGGSGYTHSRAVLDTGRILWHPDRPGMGVHIVLPASALSNFVQNKPGLDHPIRALIQLALNDGARFTRLDVCADSFTVPIETVVAAVHADQLVTRSQDVRYMQNLKGGTGGTLYIGSVKSDRLIRFYDKSAEQKLVEAGIWTRAEVQLRRDYAHQAVLQIMQGGADLESFICSAVDFRAADDSNISRRTRLSWWGDWLGSFSHLRFTVSKVVDTLERSMSWVTNSVSTSLAFIVAAVGQSDARDFLDQCIEIGAAKLSPNKRSWLLANTC